MCQFDNAAPTANGEDEWVLDNPAMRGFIERVTAIRSTYRDERAILAAIRPHFEKLLADPDWLPASFLEGHDDSGMGGGEAAAPLTFRPQGDGRTRPRPRGE